LNFLLDSNHRRKYGHWTTLVVAHRNGEFSAYYIDSLGNTIPDDIHDKLSEKIPGISILDLGTKQQKDRDNCGIFALKNAEMINDALQNEEPEEIVQRLSEYKPTPEDLKLQRIEFAEYLKLAEDLEGRDVAIQQRPPRLVDLEEKIRKRPATDDQLENSALRKPKQIIKNRRSGAFNSSIGKENISPHGRPKTPEKHFPSPWPQSYLSNTSIQGGLFTHARDQGKALIS